MAHFISHACSSASMLQMHAYQRSLLTASHDVSAGGGLHRGRRRWEADPEEEAACRHVGSSEAGCRHLIGWDAVRLGVRQMRPLGPCCVTGTSREISVRCNIAHQTIPSARQLKSARPLARKPLSHLFRTWQVRHFCRFYPSYLVKYETTFKT